MGTMNTDSSRQINAGNGVYDQSDRAKAAVRGAQSAGAGSSVVHLDGGTKAPNVDPSKKPDKQVDNVKNPAGDSRKPVGNDGQTGTDQLGNTNSVNDRKV